MKESQLQTKVLTYIRKALIPHEDLFCWKASDKFIAGIPDIVGFYKGSPFAIELKIPGNKTTAIQDVTIMRMRRAGVPVAVCYSVEEVKEFIDREVLNE